MVSVGWLGTTVVPAITARCLPHVKPKIKEKVLLGSLLFLAMILVPCCHQLGSSHLLGAFLAGVSFCTDGEVHSSTVERVAFTPSAVA